MNETELSKHHLDKLPLLALLMLSSGISVVMLGFRIWRSGSSTHITLAWNLFLAWLPLGFALVVWLLDNRGKLFTPLRLGFLFLWLLFFPNAPYIVTDIIHLHATPTIPLWYDALLLFSFAWNGLIAGIVSLWLVQVLVRKRFGEVAGWIVVVVTLTLSSYGIYLGRFLRWNSWSVFLAPQTLFSEALAALTQFHAVAVTILFASFLIVVYATVALLVKARWS